MVAIPSSATEQAAQIPALPPLHTSSSWADSTRQSAGPPAKGLKLLSPLFSRALTSIAVSSIATARAPSTEVYSCRSLLHAVSPRQHHRQLGKAMRVHGPTGR